MLVCDAKRTLERNVRQLADVVDIKIGGTLDLGHMGLCARRIEPVAGAHYFAMMKSEDLQVEFIPTASLFFRAGGHQDAAWLQFIPALAYFRRNREQ
jgi:hypothetical protein